MVQITVLFFASAREAAGDISSATLVLDDTLTTSLDKEGGVGVPNTQILRQKLAEIYPGLASMVQDEENLTLALNEEYVASGQVLPLKDGDTVALIPPISGG
jgi:molybdopterin converting factor small subunit